MKTNFLIFLLLALLLTQGCAREMGSLPPAGEFYMEASITDKPAFVIHTKWDGRELLSELEGSFLVGSTESRLKNTTKANILDDGRPQEIDYENQQPGATTKIKGRLTDDNLALEITTPDGKQEHKELPCPTATVLSDMSDMIAGVKLAHGTDEVKLSVIDLDQIKTAEATYKVIKRDTQGFTASFSRQDMSLLNLTIQFDKEGQVLSAENVALRLRVRRISAEEAKNHQAPLLNIETLTYVNYQGHMVSQAHKSVIHLALPDVDLSSSVATDAPGQIVSNNQDGSVTLTITAVAPPKKDNLSNMPETIKPYLSSTMMVPWSDPKLTESATNIAQTDVSPWTYARMATAWVNARLGKDRPERGMLTAKEALERGSGDCTEHAVLLAALLRARGIPARLAAGIAYVGGKFGFHMWTLAWIGGEWLPLDATFGYAPAPADRITMALVGADDKVENVAANLLPALGKLEINVEKSE